MISKLRVPAAPLNRFIESLYYYTGFTPEHSIDRFLPDGYVQIIFDLTDYPKYIYDNHTFKEIQSCKNVWFSGFRTEPITIPSGKESEMIIMQFKKGKAFPFISEPMHALTDVVVDAELVLKNEILDLRELLKEAKTIDEKFTLLEKNLLTHYTRNLYENPFVEYMISRIGATPTRISLKEISEKVGYSHKHIIKIFKDNVGVTPMDFLKVVRFQKAIQDIGLRKNVDWTSVALDCGFYDQSHFISDFKTFSGFTPGEYLKVRGEYLNYIPVG